MSDPLTLIRDAGVVGAGGAGFPTHLKYARPARLFLVNGAECEPLLKTDQFIMARFPERLVKAAGVVKGLLGAERVLFVLKEHYTAQARALREALKGQGGMELRLVDSVYPAGDEQALLYEAAGLRVPPGEIPIAAGAVVSNGGTLLSVADALEGRPVTHRYLTVAGCVNRPGVIHAPLGLAFQECIALAGGYSAEAAGGAFILAGGPIMGRPVANPGEEPVTKTTSGIIVLPPGHYLQRRLQGTVEHLRNRARSCCIQCNRCTELCPRRLLGSPLRPHLVMRAFGAGAGTGMDSLLAEEAAPAGAAASMAALCCECGVCEIYACPMELSPCRINGLIKQELRRRGVRPSFPSLDPVSPDRPFRRIPSRRMACRAGVLGYGVERGGADPLDHFIEVKEGNTLRIPLQMHAGAPAVPRVRPGDRVERGQCIAAMEEGKIGAPIHAPEAGIVRDILQGRIIIEGNI